MMLEHRATARRLDGHGSQPEAKSARRMLDTDMSGRDDAFNPAESLLASLSACVLHTPERVVPRPKFDLPGIVVNLHGVRLDSPPKIVGGDREISDDTSESDTRLGLLHRNLRKYGTISNTLAEATALAGTIRKKG